MESLILNATEFSPKVILDAQTPKFEIQGESRPENTRKFYEPIIQWLEQYKSVLFFQKDQFGSSKKVLFEFKFEYFNSTSAKYIMDIISLLNTFHNEGYEMTINWYYDQQDTDMRESGEEFAKLTNVPFQVIPQ